MVDLGGSGAMGMTSIILMTICFIVQSASDKIKISNVFKTLKYIQFY